MSGDFNINSVIACNDNQNGINWYQNYCSQCCTYYYGFHNCIKYTPCQPYTVTNLVFGACEETVDQLLERHKRELEEKIKKIKAIKHEIDSLDKLEKALKVLSK
jgi:predicted amidophosphoribosyltransferase